MADARVHYEVFVRKYPASEWTLDMATDVRVVAMDSAREQVERGAVAAARVNRETFDDATNEFTTLTLLMLGVPEKRRKPKAPESTEPLCVSPQDLYSYHARGRIGRLFEEWLDRRVVTAYELLHRPDLAEQLEASRVEIQHAIQKVAAPEAHARGSTVPEMATSFKGLAERTLERLARDNARHILPHVTIGNFAKVTAQVAKEPEAAYLLGCGVAAALAPAGTWSDKVNLLLDLADAAPQQGGPRVLALSVLAEPLGEIVGSKKGLDNILGGGLDLGGGLAAMSRLAAANVIDKLVGLEPSVAKVMPELPARAQRLAHWLGREDFNGVRAAIGQRILRELSGPRRLRPADPAGEIDLIRGLAMALTAAAGKLLPLDNVQAAFSARSRMLVTRDFVEAYVGEGHTVHEEAQALVWLTENVIGAGPKREAGRWLHTLVAGLKFERDYREPGTPAAVRLTELTRLQRAVSRIGLIEEDYRPIQAKLGELGGWIETDARLITQTLKAEAPALSRLTSLLKLASGETAPLGPAADRARTEALKLARHETTRTELASAPERVDAIRDLIQHASLAA
jgi:hypothetical protein